MTSVMNLDDFRHEDCEVTFATLLSAIVCEEKVNEAQDVPNLLSQPNSHWHWFERSV